MGISHDLWVAIVGGIVAAVPFWLLGVAYARWDERRRAREERSAVTTALRMEIAANLAELEAVWSEIHRPADPQEQTVAQHPLADIRPAVRLARRPPPRWRRDVWDMNLPRIAGALTPEALTRVERFYRDLARFDNRLAAIGQPWESAARNVTIHDSGVQAWTELAVIAADLRKEGNPLEARPD